MKLSLAWIFDHLTVPLASVDIKELLKSLNQKTVEVDAVTNLSLDKALFGLVFFDGTLYKVIHKKQSFTLSMPHRADIQKDRWYFIVERDGWQWATMKDFGSCKDTLVGEIFLDSHDPLSILDSLEWQDCLLEISNSAITHRPDLWCHRGFAREISALCGIALKPLELALTNVKKYEEKTVTALVDFPFSIHINTPACSRFVAANAQTVSVKPSLPFFASRLCRVDIRPINALVDGTNLVMADIGHPMHIFDAEQLAENTLIVTQQVTQPLLLLDGQTIQTQKEDIVLQDQEKSISLAGVMGGASSGITDQSKNLLIEAAHFDPSTIRKTATFHKKRTEASIRFEKNLDSNQALTAVQRFLWYAITYNLITGLPDIVVDCCMNIKTTKIVVTHQEIESMLGVTVDYRFIEKSLSALEFAIHRTDDIYTITVPSFRKDVIIKEDIVEEVGRLYGYDQIKPIAPPIKTAAQVNHPRLLLNNIRSILAFGIRMQEIKTYAFFDELFTQTIGWPHNQDSLQVAMPVSQNWKRLVTSLVPGLLKAVVENSAQHEACRFFEIGTVWHTLPAEKAIKEATLLSFVLSANDIDFYTGKATVQLIMQLYGVSAQCKQCTIQDCPAWLLPFQSAALLVDGTLVGYAGMLNFELHKALGKDVAKQLFVAEIDLDILATFLKQPKKITLPSKYQAVTRDITFWVPKPCSAELLIECIKQADPHVSSVKQLSYLEKEDWPDHRTLTVRCTIGSYEKTFTKAEIDTIIDSLVQATHSLGITVR